MIKLSSKFNIVVIVLTWITFPANEVCSQPVPTTYCNELQAYDAYKEFQVIKTWYDMVKGPINPLTAEMQLYTESCVNNAKQFPSMCTIFTKSQYQFKCVPGLMRAECLAVMMFSSDGTNFYKVYNKASADRLWYPFKIYTSLLLSATKKLSAIQPVKWHETVYRGLNVKCPPPKASRIFWKTFTSTSLDKKVIQQFGTGTTLVFRHGGTRYGARINNLSFFPNENEVLISPFEAFDFVKIYQGEFDFKSSKKQNLLG